MKKQCCYVRMLSPNKSCSKDNLDRVIDVQQYNPLIHQQLRESKIQAVIHIFATTEGPRGKSTELFQAVVQHNVRLNGKLMGEEPRNNYGPATISEAQISLKFLADYSVTQQHFMAAGTKREQQAAIFICFFLRNHVILHTFVISLPCLDTL